MNLFSAPIIVLDTETTGLPHHDWAAVVDLAGVVVERDGSIRPGSFSCLIRPEVLDERVLDAQKVHGLTPEILIREGIAPVYAADAWRRWCQQQDTPFLTSFNTAFDRKMVEKMGIREGVWCSCIMQAASDAIGRERGVQPYRNGKYPWVKLEVAATFYGIEQAQPAHRALSDALTAARVMVEIRRQKVEGARVSKGLFGGGE